MTTELPPPLVPAEVDLRDFGFMPLDVLRLRDSDLAALATGEEFKAAVLLWCVAWHQVPAASLPMDDRLLARFSGAGAGWKKLRQEALRGFVECSDGRLYHQVIADKALESWRAKLAQRERTRAATEAREAKRRGEQKPRDEQRNDLRPDTRDVARDVERDVHQGTGTVKGQGEGQGIGKSSAAQPEALPVDNSTPKADTGTLTADFEKPDRPTMIGHWVKYFVDRGLSPIACQKPPTRALMAEWIEQGITYAQMGEFMERAQKNLKGAIPSSPIYLKSMISEHLAQAQHADAEREKARAMIFGKGVEA